MQIRTQKEKKETRRKNIKTIYIKGNVERRKKVKKEIEKRKKK
jgi:hypothetical protein